MQDIQPHVEYFRFTPGPEDSQGGAVFTPFMGEVVPGRIYSTANPATAAILRDHHQWEKVSQQDHATQDKPQVSKPQAPVAPVTSPLPPAAPEADAQGKTDKKEFGNEK